MVSVNFDELKTRYPNEWLLAEVTTTDQKRSTPLGGHLLFHHRDKLPVRQKLLKLKRKGHFALIYTGPVLPEGMGAALASASNATTDYLA